MRRLTLLLALVVLVTACGPPDPWRMWWGTASTGLPWEPKELFWSKDACEAARRGLPDSVKNTYATVCVPMGLTPKDIDRNGSTRGRRAGEMQRLSLLLVLTLPPAQALAECAWVAWEKHIVGAERTPPPLVEWNVLGAYEDRQRCGRFIELYAAGVAEELKKKYGETVEITLDKGSVYSKNVVSGATR